MSKSKLILPKAPKVYGKEPKPSGSKMNDILQEEWHKQFKAFVEDDSVYEPYKRFKPLQKELLVKLFKFVPAEDIGEAEKLKMGKKSILVPSSTDPNKFKKSTAAATEKIFPLVKVIRLGDDPPPGVRLGDIYVVPYNDVIGETFNPEFIHLMNTFAQQGTKGAMAKVPEGMSQTIPNLEKNWERYKFSMPDRIEFEKPEDKLVYLIPELKLKASYNVEEIN